MRYFLITASVASFAIAAWAGLGEAAAAPVFMSFSTGFLTSTGARTVAVSYDKRHRSYHKSHGCAGDEIPELQRYQPQVRWPPSMRCHPYH